MNIKLETSPWEDDFKTVQDYVAAIKSCLGIDLDPEDIKPIPGKRAVAQICSNSLWGKFGQRQNMTQTKYVTDVRKWYEMLLNDKIEISNTICITDNMVQVTYKYKDQYVQDCFSTNVYIAAFTTSNARLRLYDIEPTGSPPRSGKSAGWRTGSSHLNHTLNRHQLFGPFGPASMNLAGNQACGLWLQPSKRHMAMEK